MEYMAQSRPRGEMNVNMLKYKLPVWQMVKGVKSVDKHYEIYIIAK